MGGLMNWAYSQGKKGVPLYSRDALDIGTAVHRMAELDLRGASPREIERIPFETLQAPEHIDKAHQAFRQFQDWRKQHDVRAISLEESLVSEAYQYGGTLDVVALIDGCRCLLDFKTSKSIGEVYLDQRLAMAAHGNLWREKYPDLPLDGGYHLIMLPKDGSKFGHHAFADLSTEWEMFTLQLECWRIEKGLASKRAVKPERKAAFDALAARLEAMGAEAKPAAVAAEAPKAEKATTAVPAKPRRTIKPATVMPAPKAALVAEAKTAVTEAPAPAAKPKRAPKPKAATPVVVEAPAQARVQIVMETIAPPPPMQLSMAELLRAYGHVRGAA
jgi:hypothetical protein